MAHDSLHDYAEDNVPPELLQQIGYETRDVTPNSILTWVGGLFVFIAIVAFGIVALENLLIPETGRTAYEAEIFRTAPIRNPPPQPQIQVLPKRDMIMYRRDEQRVLDGYSKNPEGRIAEPVDQAIDAMATEGISGVKTGSNTAPAVDAYPGSGKYINTATKGAEAPTTQDTGEAGVAAPQPDRATDSSTEDRKNVPNEQPKP